MANISAPQHSADDGALGPVSAAALAQRPVGRELLPDFRRYVSASVDHSDHLQDLAVEHVEDMVLLDDEATHGRQAKVFARSTHHRYPRQRPHGCNEPLDQTLSRERVPLSDVGVDVEEVGPRLRRKDQPLHGLG